MKNNLYASVHAIERFVQYGFANTDHPKEELEEILNFSKKTGKTGQGTQIYSSGSRPEIRFIVKEDTCVTILPPLEDEVEEEDDFLASEKKHAFEMIESLRQEIEKNPEKIEKIALEIQQKKNEIKLKQAEKEALLTKNKQEKELLKYYEQKFSLIP